MKLTANGEPCEPEHADSLSSLIDEIGLNIGRVAVLVNDEVVPADARRNHKLCEGDRVELLTFVGGG